jgi:hypothetical protein
LLRKGAAVYLARDGDLEKVVCVCDPQTGEIVCSDNKEGHIKKHLIEKKENI